MNKLDLMDGDEAIVENNINAVCIQGNAMHIMQENDLSTDSQGPEVKELCTDYNEECNQNKDDTEYKIDIEEKQSAICIQNAQGCEDDHNTGKKRNVKRCKTEIEIDCDMKDAEFDAFSDDRTVYRKYRLRNKNTQKKNTEPEMKPGELDSNEEYVCELCPMTFHTGQGLSNHIRKHKRIIVYTCSQCDVKFKTNSALIEHKNVHRNETYICEKCQLAFTEHCDYLIHQISHSNMQQYKCLECGKYYNKASIKIHVETHFQRMVECDVCSKSVKAYNLTQHLGTHGRSVECVECGKVLSSRAHYRHHLASHTGVKLHQCLYCGKAFANRSGKVVHTRSHTGERPFQCEICSQKFKQCTDFNRHMSTHSHEKKYQCGVCNKKFIHKEYLSIHMRSHTKSVEFKCRVCPKTFPTKAGLKVHVLYKHVTERPVRCEACNKGFINNNNLQKHSRSQKHKNMMYGLTLKLKNKQDST